MLTHADIAAALASFPETHRLFLADYAPEDVFAALDDEGGYHVAEIENAALAYYPETFEDEIDAAIRSARNEVQDAREMLRAIFGDDADPTFTPNRFGYNAPKINDEIPF